MQKNRLTPEEVREMLRESEVNVTIKEAEEILNMLQLFALIEIEAYLNTEISGHLIFKV